MLKRKLFRPKEDQFRSIFSKRSDIRPRSDKADLLGSTGAAAANKVSTGLQAIMD